MRARRLLNSMLFALAAALAVGGGVVAGSTAYDAVHPAYTRIEWIERAGAAADGDQVVRRALFADGRFLALSAKGYRAGLLPAAATQDVFALVRDASSAWRADYASAGVRGELIDLVLQGSRRRTLHIANPDSNLGLPDSLRRTLQLLGSADRQLATVPFTPAGLRFWSTRATNAGGEATDVLPASFPIAAANTADGVVVSGSDLALLEQIWVDTAGRLMPGLSHRYAASDGTLWRVSWTLDLDSIGRLSATGATP